MKNLSTMINGKDDTYFVISFDYDPQLVEQIRKIPGRKFDKKTKSWMTRADHISAKYVDVYCKFFGFEMNPDAIELIAKLLKPIDELNIELPPLKMELHPFQKLGVAYATKYERCIIADEMGLGKSAQAIASVEKLNAYPCLVVCPASLKLNWQKEINMWVNRTTQIISGLVDEDNPPKYESDFVIINYDIISRGKNSKDGDDLKDSDEKENAPLTHKDFLSNFGFKSIITDESHYIKNYKSNRTRAIKKIAKGIKYRFALTGTPLLNKPKELMPQLEMLEKLDAFGGFWTFAKAYCGAEQTDFGWSFGGATNLQELNSKLKDICMIRRLKSDVLSELPPKQRTYIPIEIDNMDEYKLAEKDFVKWVKNKLIKPEEYKKQVDSVPNLTKSQKKLLLKALIASKLDRAKSAEAIVKIEYLKQIVARGKLQKFKEFIDNAIEQGAKLVVFAVHREIQIALYEYYKNTNCARIFAEDDMTKRDLNVQKFQNDESCRLMISSLAAGGVGLTLTASSTVVFMEFGWTPAIHDQAEDRTHRIGQKNSVNCYYLYCDGTIDDSILELIEKKRNIMNAVVDGKINDIDTNNKDVEEILNKFI